VRCTAGSPASSTIHSLPAGTYYIVVEGPGYREVDFTLDVAFSDPTPPPVGDTCASPIALTLGTTTIGTLADKEDDIATSCGFYYRDAVYSFTLASTSDVSVVVDGAGRFMNTSVRSACADGASQIRCVSGFPARARIRALAAGTYYVIVESPSGGGFSVRVDASPPSTPVAVTGNDTCLTPFTIPSTGGLFTGSTVGMINDYGASCGSGAASPDVAFSFTLPATKHVVATTDGSTYDTVLYFFMGSCASGTDIACDDDGAGSAASLIDRVFGPGSYYIVVDGFGSAAAGDYTLEVIVSDP